MTPILYARGTTDFANNGIGVLADTISCIVTEERNGAFELVFKYPLTGNWFDSIVEGCIIKAKPNETSDLQLFRIYKSSRPINGIVTFYAEHISYDLTGIPIPSFEVEEVGAQAAMQAAFDEALLSHNFTVWSDITTSNATKIATPCSLRNVLGGQQGSILDVWGGEYEFDNYTVKLHAHRGADNGVILRYGKHLADANQEKNIAECYTHFYPYAKKTEEVEGSGPEETIIELPGKLLVLVDPENIGHQRVLTRDMTEYFGEGEDITVEKLSQISERYIAGASIGVPKINITVSFEQIWKSPEYEDFADFERVSLCDTVTVYFDELGIDAKAKVIKTEYDVLVDKYNKIVIGDAKSSLSDRMTVITRDISAEVTRAEGAEGALKTLIDQNAGHISITASDSTGTLTTVISHNGTWETKYTDVATGNVVSGINFDFSSRNFIFDGQLKSESGNIAGWDITQNALTKTYRIEYPTLTQADLDKMTDYIMGRTTLTDEEIAKYDLNGNGRVDSGDGTLVAQLIQSAYDYSDVRMTFDPTNPRECIIIEIIAGFKVGNRSAIGCFGLTADTYMSKTTTVVEEDGTTQIVARFG